MRPPSVVATSITKLLKASGDRRSRLHTLRGDLVPLGEIARLPIRVAERITGSYKGRPWLAPGAVAFIEGQLGSDASVLELGAGWSTKWFVERAGQVLSFETDEVWAESVNQDLALTPLSGWAVNYVPATLLTAELERLPGASFDLVVVDCAETADRTLRLTCASISKRLVRPRGRIVFDNSDRLPYRSLDEMFRGWPQERFVGFPAKPLTPVETTVFRTPDGG